MPDIMVRLFLFFFGYATCSLLHITLPQVSWLSTGSTTPEIFMDTNSAPHFSYGYEPRRVPGPLFRYLRTSVPQFDVSANYFVNPRIQVRRVHHCQAPFLCLKSDVPTNYFKFDVSTTVEPSSSDYVNLAGVTLHATSSSTCPRYYVPLPLTQVRRAEELLRVRRVFDVSTLLRAPSSDYVSLTGVPLDATSRAPSKSDVSTTVEPPSSDYVGLTGIPLDATSW
ncbi:hypothetical protein EDD15DRAFT_2195938 [Pisolithus albus]|nr:hypothetical protein EDD15DRAFT_2195938 [Pisolithus albus]